MQFNPNGRISNYILFINSKRECDVVLRTIRFSLMWNAYAKFVIVADFVQGNRTELVTHIFASFWKHYVINIVVVIAIDQSKANIQVDPEYLWFFFCKHSSYFCCCYS